MDLETAEPYITKAPTVLVDGKEVQMRRLGMVDWFHFLDLSHAVGSRGAREVRAWMGELASVPEWKERGMMIALFGMKHAAREVVAWIASLITWSEADVRDPEKFPLGSEMAVVEAFVEHPDLKHCFSLGLRLKKTGRVQAVLEKVYVSQI